MGQSKPTSMGNANQHPLLMIRIITTLNQISQSKLTNNTHKQHKQTNQNLSQIQTRNPKTPIHPITLLNNKKLSNEKIYLTSLRRNPLIF